MTQVYRVAEFARLCGVTVRTLQYYDRIDLLKPSDTTDGGHRLYTAPDLLRLQQIVTLKWMGFSLDEIKTILSSQTYNLKAALVAQKHAIDAQIQRLQQASDALDKAISAADSHTSDQLEAETIQAVIRGVTNQVDYLDAYYSELAQAGIALRGMAYDPQELDDIPQQWEAVYAGFESVIDESLDHPDVMAWAAKMDALITAFTGGDSATESGLRRLIIDAEAGELPQAPEAQAHFSTVDNDLREFMNRALTHYHQLKKGKK